MRFCVKACHCKTRAPKSKCLQIVESECPNRHSSTTLQLFCTLHIIYWFFLHSLILNWRTQWHSLVEGAMLNHKHSNMGKHKIKISIKWKQTARKKGKRINTNSACLPPSHLLPLTSTEECANRGVRNHKQTILIPESLLSLTQRNVGEYHYMYCIVVHNVTTLIAWLST